jgi:ParB-like chromosome segregation protein Spo0J
MKKKPAAVANLQVTYKRVPIDSLFEDPANARKHGERNLETISNSLRCFGQVESLVVQKSTGKVIGGNGRLRVMKDLGWDEVDIAEVDITDVQSVSLGIALNRTAELAEWDDEILAATLNGLALEEGLLGAAGYDEEELAAMLDQFDAAEVDAPQLADGDRDPFRQMTFTVHDSQFEVIETALKEAKSQGGGESVVNENSNGNALAFVCEAFNG